MCVLPRNPQDERCNGIKHNKVIHHKIESSKKESNKAKATMRFSTQKQMQYAVKAIQDN